MFVAMSQEDGYNIPVNLGTPSEKDEIIEESKEDYAMLKIAEKNNPTVAKMILMEREAQRLEQERKSRQPEFETTKADTEENTPGIRTEENYIMVDFMAALAEASQRFVQTKDQEREERLLKEKLDFEERLVDKRLKQERDLAKDEEKLRLQIAKLQYDPKFQQSEDLPKFIQDYNNQKPNYSSLFTYDQAKNLQFLYPQVCQNMISIKWVLEDTLSTYRLIVTLP